MPEREEHLSGSSPSDNGQFAEQMEASPSVFENKGPRILKPVPENEREELTGVQGPGGDSRPDRIDPAHTEFADISEHPMMRTTRDPQDQPEVRKEDPQFLADHRTDQDDEIVARYDKVTDGEKAVLQPRVSKQGDESENL
ncbi:MAG: hypothetical protein ACO1SV_17395 [Fimbriimonas sp.]